MKGYIFDMEFCQEYGTNQDYNAELKSTSTELKKLINNVTTKHFDIGLHRLEMKDMGSEFLLDIQ